MTDETNNANQALAARVNQVEAEGKTAYGEDLWGSAIRSIEKKMAAGEMTQTDLQLKLIKPGAAEAIFNEGIAEASEKDWRRWRDGQPHRKARIDRANGR